MQLVWPGWVRGEQRSKAIQGGCGGRACSVPLKDAVPWKGADLTPNTWLFAAAQVASCCQFYRQRKHSVDRERAAPEVPNLPTAKGTKGSLLPHLEMEN